MKTIYMALAVVGLLFSLMAPAVLAASPATATVSDIQLWAGPNPNSSQVYDVNASGGSTHIALADEGHVALTVSGNRVYVGPNTNGKIAYTISGNRLYAGPNTSGQVVYTVAGNRIYQGAGVTGKILYTINGDRVFAGASTSGQAVVTGSVNLQQSNTALQLLLPVLIQHQF